ncbi:hypothetical protein C8J57DRAFT_1536412 [Mycena rebaudengoi]|nr:hypothetical protein C8J57DRAFT_1536412 [Mycena rebaudengoi]
MHHCVRPASRPAPCMQLFVVFCRDTTTIEAAIDQPLDGPPSDRLKCILGSFLPPLIAPLLLSATTAPAAHFFATRPFRWISGLPDGSTPYQTPTAHLLLRSKLLAVALFRPMRFPTVTHRSYTPTDSIFGFYDLENGGPPTHTSHRPPRSHRYPWTPSRKRNCRTTTFNIVLALLQRRWQPRDVSYITPSSLASSQTRTRCGSMPFFPSPFRQQASIAAPDTNRSHGTVLA